MQANKVSFWGELPGLSVFDFFRLAVFFITRKTYLLLIEHGFFGAVKVNLWDCSKLDVLVYALSY